MKAMDSHRAVLLYAGIMTVALVWTMLSGAGSASRASFDVIDVHRINLREADRTLRMVIAARDRFPGNYFHGKELSHPERADVAGMLFINDEGTENGGLIFSGSQRQGSVDSSGHLSFDQYDQDQVVTLEQTEQEGQRAAGLSVADPPGRGAGF